MTSLRPWTRWLIKLSVTDRLPMRLRIRCARLNIWLLNRGWA